MERRCRSHSQDRRSHGRIIPISGSLRCGLAARPILVFRFGCPGSDPYWTRKGSDGRCTQAGDPIQASRSEVLADPADVIIPRSPTSTTRLRPKRRLSLLTCAHSVAGSATLPSNTSTATGSPARVQSSP